MTQWYWVTPNYLIPISSEEAATLLTQGFRIQLGTIEHDNTRKTIGES